MGSSYKIRMLQMLCKYKATYNL